MLIYEVCAMLGMSLLPAAFAWLDPGVFRTGTRIYTPLAIYYMFSSIGTIGLILFVMWRSGDSFRSFGLDRPQYRDAPLAVGLTLTLLFVISMIWLAFGYSGWLTRGLFAAGPVTAAAAWWQIAMMVVKTIFSAAWEELLVRAYLLARLRELLGSTTRAVVLSSVLFGVVHLYEGPRAVLVTTAMGLLLALSMVWTRRFWPLVAAHAAYNALIYISM
jgi:membrane protease YdiL (CAAX protease family)